MVSWRRTSHWFSSGLPIDIFITSVIFRKIRNYNVTPYVYFIHGHSDLWMVIVAIRKCNINLNKSQSKTEAFGAPPNYQINSKTFILLQCWTLGRAQPNRPIYISVPLMSQLKYWSCKDRSFVFTTSKDDWNDFYSIQLRAFYTSPD